MVNVRKATRNLDQKKQQQHSAYCTGRWFLRWWLVPCGYLADFSDVCLHRWHVPWECFAQFWPPLIPIQRVLRTSFSLTCGALIDDVHTDASLESNPRISWGQIALTMLGISLDLGFRPVREDTDWSRSLAAWWASIICPRYHISLDDMCDGASWANLVLSNVP